MRRSLLLSFTVLVAAAAACCALVAPASGAAGDFVYWPNGFVGESIARAGVDGTGVNLNFITGTAARAQLAVDAHYVFWANETSNQVGTIGRANLDGSGANVNFITGVDRPTAVAVDGDHVYWTTLVHAQGPTIERANVDGSGVTGLIKTPQGAYGLAVDGQHIYWTNNNGIGRADLDGGNADPNFIKGISRGRGIAVAAPYLYWANGNGIGRASLDGTGVDQSFIPFNRITVGLAVDGPYLLWSTIDRDSLMGAIGRANLDGTGVNQNLITGATSPSGLAATFQPPPASVPVIKVNPLNLDFKGQHVSTLSPPLVITVSNTRTAPLKISSVRVASGNIDDFLISRDTCTNATLPAPQACLINVRFGPIDTGPRSATLTIVSNDPATPTETIPLKGNGEGPAPKPKPAHAAPTAAWSRASTWLNAGPPSASPASPITS